MKITRQIPFAIYSVLLSLGVGLVLWLTKITGEEAAILAAIGLELVIIVHRVHHQLQHIDDPLRGLVGASHVDEATAAARAILSSKNPQARVLLETATEAFVNRIKAVHGGWIRYPPSEFMEWAEGLFSSASSGDTFLATSHLAGGEYWTRNYGKRYEVLNRHAALRGLSIQRIYLLRDQNHLDECRGVLDRQAEFADIRVVLLDDIDDSLALPRRDFFVYNKQAVAEFQFSEPGMVLDHIQISTDTDHVKEMAAEYARIRDGFSRSYRPAAQSGAV